MMLKTLTCGKIKCVKDGKDAACIWLSFVTC